jgi:hypothetical protein
MEKTLTSLEEEYSKLYKDLFNELSKVQIEQKFMERQAQTLIDDLRSSADGNLMVLLEEMIESNDPDLILQAEHLSHVNRVTSEENLSLLKEEFGSDDPENFAYTKNAEFEVSNT